MVMTSEALLDPRICSWREWEALTGLLTPEFVLGKNGFEYVVWTFTSDG